MTFLPSIWRSILSYAIELALLLRRNANCDERSGFMRSDEIHDVRGVRTYYTFELQDRGNNEESRWD